MVLIKKWLNSKNISVINYKYLIIFSAEYDKAEKEIKEYDELSVLDL